MKKNCKCFGYSGTCAQEACWLVLPTFSRLGSVLRERFNSASKVSFGNKGKTFHHDEAMKRPTAEDLVYTTDAPSFCEPNPAVGSLGTKGRYCNATSKDTDGCGLMCCGRDYKTSIERSEKYCDCVFHWCCSVKCRTCHVQRTVNICRWFGVVCVRACVCPRWSRSSRVFVAINIHTKWSSSKERRFCCCVNIVSASSKPFCVKLSSFKRCQLEVF